MRSKALKKSGECFDKLSMNGFNLIISSHSPFVLSLSKDSEKNFQHRAKSAATGRRLKSPISAQ
jgi:hypothetical protein